LSKPSVYQFTALFCARRFLIGISSACLGKFFVTNIYIDVFTSLAMIKYQLDFSPMDKPSLNQFAWLNEISLLFSHYFMFLFTDFIGNVEFRYNFIGRMYIYYVSLTFALNFILIGYNLGKEILSIQLKKNYQKKWHQYFKVKAKMANFIIFQVMKNKPYLTTLGCSTKEICQELVNDVDFEDLEAKVKEIHEKQVARVYRMTKNGIDQRSDREK
jgi:hypothetical protein